MPIRHSILRHRFGGGWAPDFGPTAEVQISDLISVPWLVKAENLEFTLDGGIRKIGGTTKLNSAELESGAAVMGLFDYWRQGSAGSPTQKRVIHVGTKIKKDDADGSFSDIFTGQTANSVPDYAIFDDYLVLMNDVSGDVPLYWDQTTAKVLGTNTPDGSFGVTHKNRFWMAGDASNPSRLYYSQALPDGADGDWTGTGAGNIDVDPGDGDRITGIASHKDELWVFKGPYIGSIHRITGSSPSDYARTTFVRGLGCVAHRLIFRFFDDLGFMWADGSIHSLNATAAFGDFQESALSLPLNKWLRDHINSSALLSSSCVNLVSQGRVAFTIPINSSSTNNAVLLMDYRFIPAESVPRWSLLPDFAMSCLSRIVDASSNERPSLFGGGYDGFVRKLDRSARSLDGSTAYTAISTFPFLSYGNPMKMKTLDNASVGLSPKGDYNAQLCWTMDDRAQVCSNVSQAGSGDTLAPSSSPFTLGTSTLGGASFTDRYLNLESTGEFRSIQFEVKQGGLDQDMEVHTITAEIESDALSLEN